MLSLNRRLFLTSAAATLAGCGFTPVYGPNGAAQGLRGAVLLDDPTDKNGYDLTKHIESRLGLPNAPRFGLSYVLTTRVEALAITQSQETTRYNVLGTLTFALRDLESGAILTKGAEESFTSFGATSNTVSTRTAREDAFARLMAILGDALIEHLVLNAEILPS